MNATAPDATNEQNSWNPWFGPLALLIGVVASIFSGVVIELIGHGAGASLTNPPPVVVDVATVAEEVGFVICAIWAASWVARPRPDQFGVRPVRGGWQRTVLAVIVGYLVFIALSGIWASIINVSAQEKYLVKDVGGDSGTVGALAAVLVFCVVAPICEEFLFRGFIFGALRNWRGPWIAAAITGVLFGALHAGSAPAADLVPLAALGMLLCAVRQLTGSLYPAIALHALNNAIALGADESWGWQIPVTIVAAALAISLLIALALRATRRLGFA